LLRLVDVATGFLSRGLAAEAMSGVATTIAINPSSRATRRSALAREVGMGMAIRVL